MKKINILNTIVVIAVLLFSACNSNSSLTKRHYSKGYHFSHSSGKHSVAKDSDRKTPLQISDIVVKPIEKNETAIAPMNPINKDLIVSNENNYNKSNAKKNVTKIVKRIPAINEVAPVIKVKKAIFRKPSSSSASDSAGLSLLWIVIVVLLILWALGLLAGGFGLGGFINILLVIALILLILWLLRII